ncbi:cytosolic phospholipase A2 gamma-like isoform X3 [Triplophysa rosa]|uniref:cytosolic phospholipase A2 gamma-like isoform X3 n=1 Tax=Triplophysa rosa TaxID=992332 RepID=UPI0025462E7F|nr:cytosolic phospholipase A2 gamma-like isoform X3 [Triplophysa rosa]
MKMCVSCSSDVRLGHSLNKQEEEFVKTRLPTVQQCLKNHGIHCSLDKVPKIALLASGGGERAMLGLLGSLVELDKTGLLDCILYLCGVSGSTWCMASLYQDSDWSTKLDSVKEKIIHRLKGPAVGFDVVLTKLMKYYKEKDNFNLTDVWAALVVSLYVKEIDEGTLSQQRGRNVKDPFPIYAVIDKQYKQLQDRDPWVEITPYEAGYSLTGAFVDVSRFGSQFHEGSKKKDQPEMDMLYLQALCGSAVAENDNIVALVWEKMKNLFHHIRCTKDEKECKDSTSLPIAACLILETLVEMNLLAVKGKDPSDLQNDIRTKLNELDGGESQMVEKSDETDAKLNVTPFTLEVFERLSVHFSSWLLDVLKHVCEWLAEWIWGRKYNFLHNVKDERVPSFLVESEKRDFVDAGLLLNAGYISVLRQERDVDLIISLDFSEGDPFLTVKTAAELCKNLNIPFTEVDVPSEDSTTPKDFYVFEGHEKAPSVIHIPLFNTVNCGADKVEEWRGKYSTFQLSYSAEMIDDLLEVAGKNITNNKEKLVKEIRKIIGT